MGRSAMLRTYLIGLALGFGLALRVPSTPSAAPTFTGSRRNFLLGASAAVLPLAANADEESGNALIRPSGEWTDHDGPFDDAFFKDSYHVHFQVLCYPGDGPHADFTTTPTGFKYKFVSPGEGERPQRGAAYNEGFQKVYVQYTGYLPDGKKFDSTYDRGSGPFAFRLGKGKVITGWESVVGGMKKGSKVIVQIPSQYAYGSAGAPDTCKVVQATCKIPPDSDVIYYIEMVNFGSVKGTD